MLDVVIYGKIIIDDIRLGDGSVAYGLLGGGGPQAAFGARLWNDSVGLLSRAGENLEDAHRSALESLDVDLGGVAYYEDVETLRAREPRDGGRVTQPQAAGGMGTAESENWIRLLSRPLELPVSYQLPRVVHLITEYADEPMVAVALAMREQGALLSLEPLINIDRWANQDEIVALLPHVDLVTPDWPSASRLAGTDDSRRVLEYWSRLGAGLVAVRNAEHGSYVWSRRDDRGWHIPAVAVRVEDTTGAGNSYGGGLCAGWLLSGDGAARGDGVARDGRAARAGAFAAVSASFMLEHVGMPVAPKQYRVAAQRRLHAIEPKITPL